MPQVFGIEHIIYLLITVPATIILLVVFTRRAEDTRHIDHVIRISGGVLLVAIAVNRFSIAWLDADFGRILPGTFCGASSLALALGAIFLKRNHAFFHCVAYIGLLGGLITIIYPDFIGQSSSIFYPKTITGLLHHSVIVFLSILMLSSGFLKPELKKWHYYPIGLAFFMTYGLFLITMLGYNDAMLIHSPILEGTILNWFVMGVLVVSLHVVILLIYHSFISDKQSKTQQTTST